ncbi:uncharacterized protein BJX67DRAFT_79635 [Aspergillus lucknowensis]|uniref:CorA-like transporter domain-containing protein n=1 Tax=Aspergillus lucknowensis TaxID=176173 RepID=A0ABR4LSM9_9EURO
MESVEFFVNRVAHPLQLIESKPNGQCNQHEFKTFEALKAHFDDATKREYTCRYISICQRNSHRPLEVTKSMLDLIVEEHRLSDAFWDLTSCFYDRHEGVEEAFCLPCTESHDGETTEISYTIRYPEYKTDRERPERNSWVIRQSGIFHRFNTATSQSLFILLSPCPDSTAHKKAAEWLERHKKLDVSDRFWLHDILLSIYLPPCRQYVASLEERFLSIANRTFATYIEEPLRLGYDNLSTLIKLDSKFSQIPTILEAALDVLGALENLSSLASGTGMATPQLRNIRRQCLTYSRTASHLQQRTRAAAQLLTDTLLFRDQVIAKEQSGNMLRLNKSAVFITTLSLLYLPASFLSAFFGMNFFQLDQDSHNFIATSMIWIFIVSAFALTAATFIFYYWLLHRDGAVFRKLKPRIPVTPAWNLKPLKQRLTFNTMNTENRLELQPC